MLDGTGAAHERLASIHISNSICWNADGTILYFADSPSHRIRAFDLEPDGTICAERQFAMTAVEAAPDGSDTDRHGNVWNAEWGGAQITVYAPDGSIALQFAVPVSQPTCVAFGGPELDHVFVTSAREDLSADMLANQPLAGDVLLYHVGPVGKRSSIFRHTITQVPPASRT
jgi:sugar lactone lactonase YvrE